MYNRYIKIVLCSADNALLRVENRPTVFTFSQSDNANKSSAMRLCNHSVFAVALRALQALFFFCFYLLFVSQFFLPPNTTPRFTGALPNLIPKYDARQQHPTRQSKKSLSGFSSRGCHLFLIPYVPETLLDHSDSQT